MNKQEFIEAVKNDPSLLDNYEEVEVDDGARGHHTAIQFKDCDEPFEFGELIDYFDGMPIVEQMYLAAISRTPPMKWIDQGRVSCNHHRLVEWREARYGAVMREKIEAELREREYKACLKRYEGYGKDK